MKNIQSIFIALLLIFGLEACSVSESKESSGNGDSPVIRLIPSVPPAYGSNSTRVTTDGTTWSDGDVVFVHIIFYADEAMTNKKSTVYTAIRYGTDGKWVAATGSTDTNTEADFTFKTVDAGANNALWSTDNVIMWPGNGIKKATIQAIYAGQHPNVELLNNGVARISVNTERLGISEMLTSTRNVSQTDLFAPIKLTLSHRLTRLDFGKELEEKVQIVSGSSGSGVTLIPVTIDFAGAITKAYNKITIPDGERYIYIAPNEMISSDANRIFRLQNPVSAAVIAAFSLPQIPSGQSGLGVVYYYGRSYSLAPQNGGGVTPDDMLTTMAL